DGRVGGAMMLAGIERLTADPGTEVLVLVSKPPGPSVAERVLAAARGCGKPVVVNFLGGDPAVIRASGAVAAATLEQAAHLAVALARGERPDLTPSDETPEAETWAQGLAEHLAFGQRYVRGLYSGGTPRKEAALILAA